MPIITTPMGAGRLIKDGVMDRYRRETLTRSRRPCRTRRFAATPFGIRSCREVGGKHFTYQNIGSYCARAFQSLSPALSIAPRLEMAQLEAWTAS